MNLAQLQFHICRGDMEAVLRFLHKSRVAISGNTIRMPRGKVPHAVREAINWLVNEWGYECD